MLATYYVYFVYFVYCLTDERVDRTPFSRRGRACRCGPSPHERRGFGSRRESGQFACSIIFLLVKIFYFKIHQ